VKFTNYPCVLFPEAGVAPSNLLEAGYLKKIQLNS
jgi:hypothetical protein